MKNILMLLKCNGLQYDDRVRKESLSLLKLGHHVDIHVLDDDNKKGVGKAFDEKISYKKYKLFTRSLFKGNKLLAVKLIEFFIRLLPVFVRKQGVIWLHDPLMFVFVPFFVLLKKLKRIELIVWDQHELPPNYFLCSKVLKGFYIWAMEHVDIRIHANKERAEYLNEQLGKEFPYIILRNFVDASFLLEVPTGLPDKIVTWLDQKPFILLQSGAHKVRNFQSVVESICCDVKVKCVVVGGFDASFIADLKEAHPDFNEYFYLVGMVPQIRLVDYIDASFVSLILYNDKEPNSLLCEPNRLYQALSRGTPVIVGDNPTMSKIVRNLKCGLVIEGNGNIHSQITNSLNQFMASDYKVSDEVKNKFSWENQVDSLEFLVNK